MRLIDEETHEEIELGSERTLGDGEIVTVVGYYHNGRMESSGRVIVRNQEGAETEFFPGVVKAKLEGRKDGVRQYRDWNSESSTQEAV